MIRYFAEHPVAANLLMVLFLAVGATLAPSLQRATFPRIEADTVRVSVIYRGAAPTAVEDAICRRIEEAVDAVDGVAESRCESREGTATAEIEMREGGNLDRFFAEVRTEIDAIDDFPDSAEDPVIEQVGRTDFVASVAVTGPFDRPALQTFARDVKERMDAFGGIPRTTLTGFSDRQLRVEVPEAALRAYGLSLTDLADVLRRQSVETPSGVIEADARYLLLRVDDRRRAVETLEDVVVVRGPEGGQVRLGEIATVTDRFELDEVRAVVDGSDAAIIDVTKSISDDLLTVMERVEAFLDAERARAPEGVTLTVLNDGSTIVRDRLSLLTTNGLQGLALVCASMWLFFGARYAFWIAAGLPVAFMGGIAAMAVMGMSLNMLTMVALLMVVGLLMDDAIVISENIAAKREAGLAPMDAAAQGAGEVMPGVLSSFLTTFCVFGSLAFLQGDLGQILRVVPVVMIAVLALSLVEAFLILPNHLGHTLHAARGPGRAQAWAQRMLERLRDKAACPFVAACVRARYVTLGVAVAALLTAVAALASGALKFTPFPELDGDTLEARILMPAGTPLAQTETVVDRVTAAVARIEAQHGPSQPGGSLVRSVAVTFGENPDAYESGPHVATVAMDVLTSEERTVGNDALSAQWRDIVGPVANAISIKFTEPSVGPAGRAIDLRLQGGDLDALKAASVELTAWLRGFEGVLDLQDDLRPGRPELTVRVSDEGRLAGLTSGAIADQLRAGYLGETVDEIMIGPLAFEVDLRLAEADRNDLAAFEDFVIRTPNGALAPLSAVAEIEPTRGWARVNRIDGARTVSVQGDIDGRIANAAEIVATLRRDFLPGFEACHPGVTLDVAGQDEETATTRASMLRGFGLGLVGVFMVLAFQFRSFVEPVVVMVLIPFAFIGAVAGHLIVGVDLTMPSMLGFAALAGVVVNDSILLVQRLKTDGAPDDDVAQLAAAAAKARFRAILLTSLTTAAGLLPLLAETSVQAQILVPLVTSLAFGLLAATAMVLVVVPAFYAILDDLGLTTRAAKRRALVDAEVAAA